MRKRAILISCSVFTSCWVSHAGALRPGRLPLWNASRWYKPFLEVTVRIVFPAQLKGHCYILRKRKLPFKLQCSKALTSGTRKAGGTAVVTGRGQIVPQRMPAASQGEWGMWPMQSYPLSPSPACGRQDTTGMPVSSRKGATLLQYFCGKRELAEAQAVVSIELAGPHPTPGWCHTVTAFCRGSLASPACSWLLVSFFMFF